MKNILYFLLVIMILVSLVIHVSAEPEYTIKYVAYCAPQEPMAKAFSDYFKPMVEAKSDGRIEVQVYHSGMLGGERDVIEGLQIGTIEMTAASYGLVTNFVPRMEIFSLPYLFENVEHCYAVLDSELGMGFKDNLAKEGFELLGYCDFGVRNVLTTKNPINSLSDLKGLKIRVMEIPTHIDAFNAFGASPVPMAYSEVYTAMQTGVIDGMEAANVNYYAQKFFEVAPNYAMVNWIILSAPLLVSKPFYDKLPADLQKIINDVARETIKLEREMYNEYSENSLNLLKEEGINITYPNLEPFREAARKVYEKWADQVGGIEKIDEVINFDY